MVGNVKFLKVNTNYAQMFDTFAKKYQTLQDMRYDTIKRLYLNEYYWPSNSLEKVLTKYYGWECETVFFCADPYSKISNEMNKKWFNTYGQKFEDHRNYRNLLMQIAYYNPDILYLHETRFFNSNFVADAKKLAPNLKKVIGWDCSGVCEKSYVLDYYDGIFTCAESVAEQLAKQGANAFLSRHGFDPGCLDELHIKDKDSIDVVFIGCLYPGINDGRVRLLKDIVNAGVSVEIYTPHKDIIQNEFSCEVFEGLFGVEMYEKLASSKIVLNMYQDKIDARSAGNLRLYEATGVGSCLVNEYRDDLGQKFSIGDEVVSFKDSDEVVKKIKWLLSDEELRVAIAKNGQRKTLDNYDFNHLASAVFDTVAIRGG